MKQLIFYVPIAYCERVKTAVFAAQAGRYKQYDQCCWQSRGQGQFRPLQGSHAFIGEIDQLEKVEEYKVEMICTDDVIEAAVKALKQAHPYEEPVYAVITI